MQSNLPWTGTAPPGDSSQLDPVEIAVSADPCSSVEGTPDPETGLVDTFRHSGWATRRRAILDALHHAQQSCGRIARFKRCGADRWIVRNRVNVDVFKIVTAKCHDRLCSPCIIDRQAVLRRNLHHRLADQRYRLLTLTLRHDRDPLRPLFNKLYTAFRKLRQTSIWRDRVDGGCSIFELTYNGHGHGWHPHIHCILDGRYIDVTLLRRHWLSITGDSNGVDLSIIRNKRTAVDYVSKYATKAMPAAVFRDRGILTEAIDVLARRRLIVAFGTWRNWRLMEDPRDKDWESFDSIDGLRFRARQGDELASRILAMIPTADPQTAEFVVDLDLPPPEE